MGMTDAQRVDDLIALLGRERLKSICAVGNSAISMWKVNGVPESRFGAIVQECCDQSKPVPEWLVELCKDRAAEFLRLIEKAA